MFIEISFDCSYFDSWIQFTLTFFSANVLKLFCFWLFGFLFVCIHLLRLWDLHVKTNWEVNNISFVNKQGTDKRDFALKIELINMCYLFKISIPSPLIKSLNAFINRPTLKTAVWWFNFKFWWLTYMEMCCELKGKI